MPIGIVGLPFKDPIETTLAQPLVGRRRADPLERGDVVRRPRRHPDRGEKDVTWKDTLIIGTAQCLALVPGVSRSGATMSAGLLRDLDRVTVTWLSFFLSIPALTAATVLQVVTKYDDISGGVGWAATLTATVVSFMVAYFSVAWLLKYVAKHSYTVFIVYRVVVGSLVLLLDRHHTISAR